MNVRYVSYHIIDNVNMKTSACSGSPLVITMKNRTDISSPGYQQDEYYPNNMDCEWSIVADQNKIIRLVIKGGSEVEKEYVYDQLQHLKLN